MDRSCSQNVRSAFKILTSKPTERRLLGWRGRKWEDNTMDLKETDINQEA
jgi:hypothetical protein